MNCGVNLIRTSEWITQSYPTTSDLKWKIRKVQRKAMRMQKPASLYKRIGGLLEEEADELNEHIESRMGSYGS